jgi:hypothetical protein
MRILTIILVLLAGPARGQQETFSCDTSSAHRAFDFWVGDWEVRDAQGKLQGYNAVTAVQDGCALQEHWHSVRGGTGQSINYYHPGHGHWRQLWTDAGASIIDIRGGPEGEAMVLSGTIYYLDSQEERLFRGRWTPLADGRVRQFFEEQDESGAWQPWFEGFYSRR